MLFALPGIILVIVVAARRSRVTHGPAERDLRHRGGAADRGERRRTSPTTQPGITQTLWRDGDGVPTSPSNDVLHVGMILWLWFVAARLGPTLTDRTDTEPIPAG